MLKGRENRGRKISESRLEIEKERGKERRCVCERGRKKKGERYTGKDIQE